MNKSCANCEELTLVLVFRQTLQDRQAVRKGLSITTKLRRIEMWTNKYLHANLHST